jgi:hypothetical protein
MRTADRKTGDAVPLKVLLASSTWWSAPAKLALAFLRNGCKVEVVCGRDHPFRFISGIKRIHHYRGLNSLKSLDEAITLSDPDLVVPCDDTVVWQLHELHRTKLRLQPLIERSLGVASSYGIVAGRAELMEIAQELEIRTPQTRRIAIATDLEEWFSVPGTSGVLKADRMCSGKAISVVHSLAEAEQARAELCRPMRLIETLARWLFIHDATAIWKRKNIGSPKLSIQQFIPGPPANAMLACRDGKVLAMVMVEVLCAQGETGPSLVVRLIENQEMRTTAERIAHRLNLSGLHGLDFILEEGTGNAYLIELNPRCTQLGHLQIAEQGDLVGVLCGTFTGSSVRPKQKPIDQETIAFFPQALLANPKSPYLKNAYVDVPLDEPRLVREMMRRDWRDRNFLVRSYHVLRPPHRPVVVFEPKGTEGSTKQKTFRVSAEA